MFRELTRKNKKLSHEECIEILKNTRRGVNPDKDPTKEVL